MDITNTQSKDKNSLQECHYYFKCANYKELLKEMKQKNIKVDCIFTDPPYNISRDNNFTTIKRTGCDFGEWDRNFKDQEKWIRESAPFLKNGGSFIIFNDFKNLSYVVKALESCGCTVKDLLRWEKSNPMPRNVNRRYVSDCEFALWAVKGKAKWTFNKPSCAAYLKPSFKSSIIGGGGKIA